MTSFFKTIAGLFLILLTLHACKSTKYASTDLPPTYFSFGDGGGFMGAYKEYVLLENGQLFHRDSIDKAFKELPVLKKRISKNIYKKLNEINFEEVERNSPGNIYKFMEYNKDGKRYRMVWGSSEKKKVDEMLDSLYKLSLEAVRKKKEDKK